MVPSIAGIIKNRVRIENPPAVLGSPPIVIGFPAVIRNNHRSPAGYAHPYHSHYEGLTELERPWKYYQQPLQKIRQFQLGK